MSLRGLIPPDVQDIHSPAFLMWRKRLEHNNACCPGYCNVAGSRVCLPTADTDCHLPDLTFPHAAGHTIVYLIFHGACIKTICPLLFQGLPIQPPALNLSCFVNVAPYWTRLAIVIALETRSVVTPRRLESALFAHHNHEGPRKHPNYQSQKDQFRHPITRCCWCVECKGAKIVGSKIYSDSSSNHRRNPKKWVRHTGISLLIAGELKWCLLDPIPFELWLYDTV